MKLLPVTALLCLLWIAVLGSKSLARADTLSPDGTAIRRFALIASSNDGGPTRTLLRFANSDAESVKSVLSSLGGVRETDIVLLRDAGRPQLQQAFGELRTSIAREKRPQVRREVFVYYSGHSDDEGLLLGRDRVAYRELRTWIDGLGAEVRIAILDSCASGSLIRLKGGVRRAPFLSDVSTQARGHAFLTASSADEAAQESDRIGSAFFTHYLLSGMRGAADANRDQRVTLNEAYQFAYNETLQRTEKSHAGAQHPAYDIQLAGTGDLVMTDLHASGARLVLGRDLAGRVFVRDSAGRLIVELRKEPTYPVELGLDAGTYKIVVDTDGRLFDGSVEVPTQGRVDLTASVLTPTQPLVATRRGDAPPGESPPGNGVQGPPVLSASSVPNRRYRHVGFDLVLAPGYRLSGDTREPVEHSFVLGLLGHSDYVTGAQLSLAGSISQDGVMGAQIASAVALSYGPVAGVQMSAYNLALGGIRGAQVGWISVARSSVYGAQVSLVNVSSGSTDGAQVGMANVQKGDIYGAQVGLVNVDSPDKESRGVQVGLTNVTRGSGTRAAPSVGLVNVARKQRGVQVGIVNVADEVDGIQVGIISVARKNTAASISLLPVVMEGDNRLTLGWSSTSLGMLGAKLGTRRFYVALGAGIANSLDAERHREYTTTLGFGGHVIPRGGKMTLDLDVVTTHFATLGDGDTQKRWVHGLRLQVGYAIARHLAVVAGPVLNVQVADGDDDRRPRGVGFADKTWTSGSTTVRLYPGFSAGLEF